MVIRPRTLEEIAQEQASAEPAASQARTAGPPTAATGAPPAAPVSRPEGPRGSLPVDDAGRRAAPTAARPSATSSATSQEGEGLWDPFAQDAPSPGSPQDDDPDAPRRRTPDLWKPAEEPQDTKTRLRTWGIASGAIAGTVFAVWLAFSLNEFATSETAQRVKAATTQWLGPPQPTRVAVVLINECPFSEKAFMAKVMPDGPTAEFIDGKASLEALPNQRIKLIANTKYPQFHYDSGSFPVGPEVRLTANCDNMEERAKAISESLRDAFKK